MDESKKAVEFVKYGHWPGKKVRLTSQQWEGQVNHALSLISDYVKNMSGFVPIQELINVRKKNYHLITDPQKVIFSVGINLNTHCHLVYEEAGPYDSGDKPADDLFSRPAAFLTRKMEWIGWINNVKSEFSFDEKKKPIFRKDRSFHSEFYAVDLKDLLKWDHLFGRNFIQHIRLRLVGDIYQGEGMILRQRSLLSEFNEMVNRIEEAVEY